MLLFTVVVVVVVMILKLTLLHEHNAMKAYRGNGGESPHTLILDIRCKCAISHKLWSVVLTIKETSM